MPTEPERMLAVKAVLELALSVRDSSSSSSRSSCWPASGSPGGTAAPGTAG